MSATRTRKSIACRPADPNSATNEGRSRREVLASTAGVQKQSPQFDPSRALLSKEYLVLGPPSCPRWAVLHSLWQMVKVLKPQLVSCDTGMQVTNDVETRIMCYAAMG